MTGGTRAEELNLVVAGAGLIGQRHIEAIARVPGVRLSGVIDPAPPPGCPGPVFASLAALLADHRPDGVILATPTLLHHSGALDCIAAGLPVLVEKPLTATLTEARSLTLAAETAGVPVLVGHHRRHNPLIRKAASLIAGGAIGTVRAVQTTCWFYKPDHYFDAAPWRKQKGAGPISVNLVHDIDLLRLFCGEVVSVQAQKAPALRGFENEDLASALLRFESGALATISVSDSIAAPWSWELTARENPAYPATSQSCYLIGGSAGALSLPDLRIWRHDAGQDGGPDWWQPISATNLPFPVADPLDLQIGQFAAVIRGEEAPLVPASEGLRTMAVIEAVARSAETGQTIHIADL